jgi:hypothetical protein
MTDKKLLEAAARAAGIDIEWAQPGRFGGPWATENGVAYTFWNPLTNDAEALRLAVKLNIAVTPDTRFGMVHAELLGAVNSTISEDYGNDPYAATRRAIVRAAAEIWGALK